MNAALLPVLLLQVFYPGSDHQQAAPSGCNSSTYVRGDGTCSTPAASIPTGLIVMTLTSCPSGFSEEASLNGKFVLGTVAANGDVTTTGGVNSVTPSGTVSTPTFTGNSVSSSAVSAGTPAGTVATGIFTGTAWTPPALAWPAGVPTFTGSALATHTHTVTATGTNGASATSGNCAATNIAAGTGSTTACKATAPNLTVTAQTFTGSSATSSATSGGTPAGTIAWPTGVPTIGVFTPAGTIGSQTFTGSALSTHTHSVTATGSVSQPTFTGVSQENRPAFVKVIFCKAN